MSSKITVEAVKTALEQVVAAEPGRVDKRVQNEQPPRYVANGKPFCLVAKVLARLGFSVGVLHALDREHPLGALNSGVQIAESRHPALKKIDDRAIQLLQYAQKKQDSGLPWGFILREAFTPPSRFSFRERHKPWLS